MFDITVSPSAINIQNGLDVLTNGAPNAGAIVSFSGVVRPINSSGQQVKALTLQAYAPLTVLGVEEALAQATRHWPLLGAVIAHRIGDIPAGETIVFVATASKHRRAAFNAADFLMDYLKTRAYFWKQEITANGSSWVEPRDEDYSDAQKWDILD